MQDTYKEVVIVLIGGSVIFLALSGVVVFVLLFYQKKRFQHRQELLKTQLETREETFLQVSEEIHDNVGQLLSTSKILLGITERSLPDPPDTLHTAAETLGKAIQDLRSLSKTLNKEWLKKFNIIDNLRTEVDRINASRVIQTSLDFPGNELPLGTDAQIMLFRIIQEGLQNIIKHAEANTIRIGILLLHQPYRQIEVRIVDDGKGFDPSLDGNAGMGLQNMRHRVSLLGGSISWNSPEGGGAEVAIILPFGER